MVHSSIEDPDRLADLAASGLMDSPPEETFDRFTHFTERFLTCPLSLVSLIAKERQFFIISFLGLSFCLPAAGAHGGRIWSDSSPSGEGLFQVPIPL